MNISVITVFPELYKPFFETSLLARAQANNLVFFNVVGFADVCKPTEPIDEPTCGHGAGMLIKPDVVQRAIEQCEQTYAPGYKIFFSPQGKTLTQPLLQQLAHRFFDNAVSIAPDAKETKKGAASSNHIILVCARYEGMDTRVEEHYADLMLSVGDYVVMGGDAPALIFLEGLLRLMPSVVGRQESVEKESFTSCFLDYPSYGLPVEWQGKKVPDVVLSGNHGALDAWRQEEAAKKTIVQRFDWFKRCRPDTQDITLAKRFIPNHYVALMHTDVLIRGRGKGTTSVASLDLHDICRSSATYGISSVFMVTPLKDQQAIIEEFLSFWRSEEGKSYNQTRFEAVSLLLPTHSFDETIEEITKREGCRPLVVATSAQEQDANQNAITYCDQGRVWQHKKPILFLFGTGQGLCPERIASSDFVLQPIMGMTDYRHLSVRAAVAIVLDRWLGLN